MSTEKKGWLASIFRAPDPAEESVAAPSAAGTTGPPAVASVVPPPVGRTIASPPLATSRQEIERRRVVPLAGPAARPLTVQPPPLSAPPLEKIERARMVLAVDATASRARAWKASQEVMGAMFTALPGELDVALAVHGGGKVQTFTGFMPDVKSLRRIAARVTCKGGYTKLLEIFERVLKLKRVRVVVYVGDVFEESRPYALRLAKMLAAKDTRVIILHDTVHTDARYSGSLDHDDGEVFRQIAAITGGAVLPFDASALDRLSELLQAVSVLAVGGPELLETKQQTMPAAPLLIERIAASKQLLIRSTWR